MREHVALEFENVRVCGRVGRFYRTRYRCCAGLFDCDQFVLACDPVSDQAFAQDGHRIVRQRLGIFCLVDVAASITDQMTVETERSEEHTSELQSLMRISYAVFCLKKQKKQKHNLTIQ